MSDNNNLHYLEGVNAFQSARSRAFWKEMIGLLRGKPAELLSFEDIKTRLRLREESYKGLQEVLLERIVGSVGRYRDFTGEFLPKNSKMQERWSRVYAQANGLEGMPPIELYKV
ncbi:MAG: transcriptional regulator, partial [Anaerolineae bacterium]|nr:transcriptional regulator [Anaerolineae bacterium]